MNPQRRRLVGNSSANSSLNSLTADDMTLTLDESNAVNVHGLRYCMSIEPENADANANGFAVVYCFPAGLVLTSNANLLQDFSDFNNDDVNPYIWGITCWTASNQAPYHWEFNPKTSRTCQHGARIVAQVIKTGISAGNVRINQSLTCFTTS